MIHRLSMGLTALAVVVLVAAMLVNKEYRPGCQTSTPSFAPSPASSSPTSALLSSSPTLTPTSTPSDSLTPTPTPTELGSTSTSMPTPPPTDSGPTSTTNEPDQRYILLLIAAVILFVAFYPEARRQR